jgi:ferric-dicitrate binding protein FerR (iron transport regulator)
MKLTQGNVEGDPAPAAVRWFCRFLGNGVSTLTPEEVAAWAKWSSEPSHLEQFRRVKQIWCSLGPVLSEASPPPITELAADNYDESVAISRWLTEMARTA